MDISVCRFRFLIMFILRGAEPVLSFTEEHPTARLSGPAIWTPADLSHASHEWPPEKAHPDQDVFPPAQTLVDGEVVGVARNIVWLRIEVEGVIKDGRMTLAPDELGKYQVGDHVTDLELVMATPGDWCHILAIPHGFGSTLRRPARAVTDVAGPVDGGS